MKRTSASGLLFFLVASVSPAVTSGTIAPATNTDSASSGLQVDEFLSAAAVTTSIVMRSRCPVETISCPYAGYDCGVIANKCHCAGPSPSKLVCVANLR